MKWITNLNASEIKRNSRLPIGVILLEPKATEHFTVEQLTQQNIVGVYISEAFTEEKAQSTLHLFWSECHAPLGKSAMNSRSNMLPFKSI